MNSSSLLKPQASGPQISKLSSHFSSAHFAQLIEIAFSWKHAAQIHAQLVTRRYISSPILFNKLLALYSRCGQVLQSLALFSVSNSGTDFYDTTKNVFTYTSLITQLSHSRLPVKALSFFNEMRGRNIYPNHFTFSAILPACGVGDVDAMVGKQMHSLIFKHGFESDVFVSSALVDMYANFGDINCAEKVFDEMPERNLVCWNSLLVGLLRNGYYHDAVIFFSCLLEGDLRPDQVCFSSVLIAIANLRDVTIGRQVHGIVIKHGLEFLAYVKNSLMDLYCKCGFLDDAKHLFRTIEDGDVVTWNVMVMGLVQNGDFDGACDHFWCMIRGAILPDEVSFSTVLHAAANVGSLDQGSVIHCHVVKAGFGRNICVSSSLISVYAKCGSLVDARRAFTETDVHNVITWTAMISAFQQHGYANQVIELFNDMIRAGIDPDFTTFVSVLSACAHTGHVDFGYYYFDMMRHRYSIDPGVEHYACMVDLLGRAGRLQDALKFVEEMPIEPDASVWGALLGSCREYGNIDMGEKVARELFRIEPDNPANYVILHNMYARRGRREEANEVRKLMEMNRVRKEAGSCFQSS